MPSLHHIITLRPATLADLSTLRYWDEQPHVIASDPDGDWAWETELRRNPDWREQLIAEYDGQPIGFLQIIDPALEDSQYWGDIAPKLRAIDIWIGEAKNLNRGFGTVMMHMALERCFADNKVQAVLIDPLESNVDAIRFYERLGFECLEKRRFGDDDCLVYRMTRERWFGKKIIPS